ncbi:hypothetical protein QAD02_019708 [Eretmocerus hayati]|uniref:Uncharacterized protein n=1 Tax=Eretmocerus hayati TaxID=131215 RepID=A0ACC2PKD4_9HYME|nr:hypothetical protein QAD02_019708 [Eretmocerus hayati]
MTSTGDTDLSHWPSQLCRLCAENRTDLIGIYEPEGLRLDIQSKIVKCLRIQVFMNDNLPLLVCWECYRLLNQSYEFCEKTHQAQHCLRKIFFKNGDILHQETLQSTLQNIDNLNGCHVQEEGSVSMDESAHSTHEAISSSIQENRDLMATNHEIIEKDVKNQNTGSVTNHIELALGDENISMLRQRLLQTEKLEPYDFSTNEVDRDLHLTSIVKSEVQIPEDYMTGTEADIKMIIETKKHSCLEQTPVSSKTRKGRKMHRYPWLCTDCNDKLPSLNALEHHHFAVHEQRARYMCVQCCKVFEKYCGFLTHVNRHKTRAEFSCEECGKVFADEKILNSHKVTHSRARPHICQNCGKTFKQKSALDLHARCHLPENMRDKFPCDVCGKSFSTKPNLVTHTRIHTGVRNYICDQCGKRFIQKGNLEAHCKIHTLEKPYQCSACPKAFKTPMQLKKHATVHSGDRPYQCDICGRAFREKGTLKEHHRIHTGAMPFSCEFCGKRFRFKGILTTHRRQHTGERPYSCNDCQHHFTNWPNYNKHMKRRHGIDTAISKQQKPDQKQPLQKPKVRSSQKPEVPEVNQEPVQQRHQTHDDTSDTQQPMTVTATTVQVIQTVPQLNASAHPMMLQTFQPNPVSAIQIVETSDMPANDPCRQVYQRQDQQSAATNAAALRERGVESLCASGPTAYFNTLPTSITNFFSPALPYNFYNVPNVNDDNLILPE